MTTSTSIQKYVLALAMLLGALCAAAQEPADSIPPLTAAKCFVEAPMSVIPFANKSTRLDMMDYFRAGSGRASQNDYGGESWVESEMPLSLTVAGSECLTYQIFVLNRDSERPLIGVIETMLTPMADSRLRVYDTKWTELPDAFAEPLLADWLTAQGRKQRDYVAEALPFIMAQYAYDPDTGTLTVTQTMDGYFAQGEGDKALSLINHAIPYKWDGKTFQPVKIK